MWFKRGCETRRREEEGAVIVGEQARTHTQLPQDPFWKDERERECQIIKEIGMEPLPTGSLCSAEMTALFPFPLKKNVWKQMDR